VIQNKKNVNVAEVRDMKKYIKIYADYFGYEEYLPCEVCLRPAVDVHHIKYKSRGGLDILENLMGLCRECHNLAHDEKFTERQLREIHLEKIKNKSHFGK